MFDNPEITRQLVNGRLDLRRRQAAARRLAGPRRRRHRARPRTARTLWFGRRRRGPALAPEASPA